MAQNKDLKENKEEILSKEVKKNLVVEAEEAILAYWKEKGIFEKTLKKDSPRGDFVFYEGPPTANGRPGIHHLESRAFKDLFPRYKTMQGYRVLRKAGWDTHGLPVELEVEKQIGVTSKKEIEAYGIARFNEECKKSVWKYVDEWERFTERIGYWVDLKHPYITYTPDYIESIWNIFSQIESKKLLYKDYKVVPWCPRCGTALSSHELAQGYADVKDLSVYVLFKDVNSEEYFSAWTTTPWTLPGNCALAVGGKIEYVLVRVEDKNIWMANDRAKILYPGAEVVKTALGSELVGREYESLYPFLKNLVPQDQKENIEKAWKIYPASFVSTEDGTGIVHTAVMYGQDDFELGTQIGLPKFHLVDETGLFIENTGIFSRRFVKDEEVAVDVIKDLAHRGLLLKKEKYEHSYPFCWRCKTPLIYYARDSWYIRMSSLRDELMRENQTIHWEPEHTRDGRFGEWLKEVKDWAISRERYWGTPLPIWESEDKQERVVIGSVDDLRARVGSRNKFFLMRHGGAIHNVKNVLSSDPEYPHTLTEEGKGEVKKAAENLKSEKIDAIYVSDFVRTKETAEIVASILGIPNDQIFYDARLREMSFGDLNGKSTEETWKFFSSDEERFEKAYPHGESFSDVRQRVGEFLHEINKKHEKETILVISHEVPLWLLESSGLGLTKAQALRLRGGSKEFVRTAGVRRFNFVELPHSSSYELDLHRPHIDTITFPDSQGKPMKRVLEVMDVWFDSGAMPYAQHHYPFENKEWFDEFGYPADFICEAIDQTRGWFYTLHAIGTLLGKGKAFKNVICLGHILDKDGQKMSKSRGNTLNPWEKIDQYGADVLRFWMYSVNQPGESKNFDERTVDDVVKKVFNLLLNVVSFYEMYKTGSPLKEKPQSTHPLDRWITISLEKLELQVTNSLDEYRPLEGARVIRDFIADLSQWYVRRSRDRFKGDDEEDKKMAIETLSFVLLRVSKVLAPFTPFLSEYIYQKIGGNTFYDSVHLESWSGGRVLSDDESKELDRMQTLRSLVTLSLEARATLGIKIRQPLRGVTLRNEELKDYPDLVQVLLQEINVKDAFFDSNQDVEIVLDGKIDENLRREGDSRELIRAIQESRKQNSLVPGDVIDVSVETTSDGEETITLFSEEIKKVCNIRNIKISINSSSAEEVSFGVSISRA